MIDFNNLENAFVDKSDADLNRAYLLFKSISNQSLSKILTNLVKFALKINLPIKPIIKATLYKHFCGGETIIKCQNTINKLWKSNIGTILDYSAESKESTNDFKVVLEQTLASIKKAAKSDNIPFTVFKATGICRFMLLEKINKKCPLTAKEELEKKEYEERVNTICKLAFNKNVPVFIDAEESWIQNAIDNIAEEMMKKYNQQKPLIYNTVQLYRKDRIEYITKILERSKKGYFVGLKIVRGAYHEKEINRAMKYNYECPVYLSKSKTDTDYNKALEICLKNINRMGICAGTHNEKSSKLLVHLMNKYKLEINDKRIHFSQLLGMSDNISYNLSIKNYNVSKYVPYGPVKDVTPYLIRRAQENTSISGQMSRELKNISAEIKRRRKKKIKERKFLHY